MQVVTEIPRTKVTELWSKVVKSALAARDADALETGKRLVISAHLTYYSSRRSEFYSPVDPTVITGHDANRNRLDQSRRNLTHVVLLIDDVFDMYARLRGREELYADTRVGSFLNRIFNQGAVDAGAVGDLDVARLTLGWQVRALLSLLAWREQEVLLAEALSHISGVPENRVLVWAVKQSTAALANWIDNADRPAVYLSHPITEARKERRLGDPWPRDFVDEGVNRLQTDFDALDVTLVAPTGIDELRFESNGLDTTGLLEPRWPLPLGPSLYSKPPEVEGTDGAPDYGDLLCPRRRSDGRLAKVETSDADAAWISASLQALVREVETQVAARDLFLVYHTDGLLVYRPLYNTGDPRPRFSAGVRAEVELWSELCKLGVKRRMAVVHMLSEVESLAKLREGQNLNNLAGFFQRALRSRFRADVPFDVVASLLRSKGELDEPEELLRKHSINTRTLDQMVRFMNDRMEDMKQRLLEDYLVGDVISVGPEDSEKTEMLRAQWAIWVVDDGPGITADVHREIAGFLRTGSPRGNAWHPLAGRLIPDPS
jgi:hypothetical protein